MPPVISAVQIIGLVIDDLDIVSLLRQIPLQCVRLQRGSVIINVMTGNRRYFHFAMRFMSLRIVAVG